MSNVSIGDSRVRIGSTPSNQVIKTVEGVTRVVSDTSIKSYINPNTLKLTLASLGVDSEGNQPGSGLQLGGLYGVKVSGNFRSTISTGNIGSLPMTGSSLFTSIDTGDQGDSYGQIWIGYFVPPETGTWTFYTASDDGSGVWVGEIAADASGRTTSNAVLNNNMGAGQGRTERSGSTTLTGGQIYPIRIVHEEGSGGDSMTFWYSGPNVSKTTDLTQHFYYVGDGSDFADTTPTGFNTIGYTDLSSQDLVDTTYFYESGFTLPKPIMNIQRVNSFKTYLNTAIQGLKTRIQSRSQTSDYELDDGLGITLTNTRTIQSNVSASGGGETSNNEVVTTSTLKQIWY